MSAGSKKKWRRRKLEKDREDRYFRDGVTLFSEDERKQLKLDKVAMFSTTSAQNAKKMSELISNLPGLCEESLGRKPEITDSCAGCGGNMISLIFSGRFRKVTGVEIDRQRAHFLRQNIQFAFTVRNSETQHAVFHDSYLNQITMLQQDVVFLDPPWGGVKYKNKKKISLHLNNVHIAFIVIDLFRNAHINNTKYIVLKVPLNFDIGDMCQTLGSADYAFSLQPEQEHVKLMQRFKKYNILCIDFLQLSSPHTNIIDASYRLLAQDDHANTDHKSQPSQPVSCFSSLCTFVSSIIFHI